MMKAIEHVVQKKIKKTNANFIRKPLTGIHKRINNFSSFVSSKLTSRKISRSNSKSRSELTKQFENWRRTKNLSCLYSVNQKNKFLKQNYKLIKSKNFTYCLIVFML
jgi:hypothetical protein